MNSTLIKGICEELEFDTEIGDYKVNSSSFDGNKLNLTITDCENEFNVIIADVRIGKLRESGLICISVSYKKSVWNKTFDTYGVLVDNTDSAIKFLKDCAISIIKKLDQDYETQIYRMDSISRGNY